MDQLLIVRALGFASSFAGGVNGCFVEPIVVLLFVLRKASLNGPCGLILWRFSTSVFDGFSSGFKIVRWDRFKPA